MANVTWDSGNKSATIALTGLAASASSSGSVEATSGQSAGKYYFEYTLGPISQALSATVFYELGFGLNNLPVSNTAIGGVYLTTESATTVSVRLNNSVAIATWTPASLAAGTVIGVAVDMDNQRAWFRVAGGNWNNSGTADPTVPSTGLSIVSLFPPGTSMLPRVFINSVSNGVTANFGDSAFSGAVPTGFTAGVPTGGINNALITQEGAEVWRTSPATLQFTQIGVAVWQVSPANVQFSQIGVEVWRSVANAPASTQQPIVMALA